MDRPRLDLIVDLVLQMLQQEFLLLLISNLPQQIVHLLVGRKNQVKQLLVLIVVQILDVFIRGRWDEVLEGRREFIEVEFMLVKWNLFRVLLELGLDFVNFGLGELLCEGVLNLDVLFPLDDFLDKVVKFSRGKEFVKEQLEVLLISIFTLIKDFI